MKKKKFNYKDYMDILVNHPERFEKFIEKNDFEEFDLNEYKNECSQISLSKEDGLKLIGNFSELMENFLREMSWKIVSLSFERSSNLKKEKELKMYLTKLIKVKNYFLLFDSLPISIEPINKLIIYVNNELVILENDSPKTGKYFNQESHQINWLLTIQDFAFLMGELKSKGFVKDTYKNLAQHFLIKGEQIDINTTKDAYSKVKSKDAENRASRDIEYILKELYEADKKRT